MARNEQLIRQHKIIQVLERRRYGATLEDLRDTVVDELGLGSLHTRSIRRDIEALQAAGMPIITEDTANGKVWKMSRADTGLHRLTITASELIALSMGRDLMIPLVGTQFWQGIEAFWNKVREQLPPGVWEHYERYRRTLRILGVVPKTYEKQQGMLKTINRAIQEHRRLEVVYEASGSTARERLLEPYGLAIFQSSIYLVAVESGQHMELEPQERLRHWKLDRFQKATALDDWFKPSEEIDLDAHLGRSVGIFSGDRPTIYRIRLNAKAARWVQEEPWHAEQQLESCSDGTSILSVPAYHPLEVIPQVLRLGSAAELLEPESAREILANQIEEMAARYKKEKPSTTRSASRWSKS
ncbi:MAG: helix-turn-helix transcriptional regulator [Pirellula sp.]